MEKIKQQILWVVRTIKNKIVSFWNNLINKFNR